MEKFFKADGGVLVFHEVYQDEKYVKNKQYAISKESFKKFIEGINRSGGEITHIGKAISEKKRKCFAISFDDGYDNVCENALPYLEKWGIPYTLFLTTDFIETEGYITRERILQLKSSKLCEIGGHTKTHPWLAKLNGKETCRELGESKVFLETMLDNDVRYLAYPYGSLNAVKLYTIKAAKWGGYLYAFSTFNVSNRFFNYKYFYPRITVTENNWEVLLERLK